MGALDRQVSVEDFRRLARRRLPKSIFEFIDGGAGQELTLNANRSDFEKIRLLPRVLTDVSHPNVSTTLWSETLPTPLVISPMGSCALVRPGADIAIARAATARGIPYTLSTMATASIEGMARAVQGPLWFQLYVLKDFDFNRQLVRRAEEFGYSTLVVTVDLQAGGKREKDLRNGISIPLRPSARHLWEGMLHPGWSLRLLRGGLPQFENVRGYLGDNSAGLTIAVRVGGSLHAGFDWDDFRQIRDWWKAGCWSRASCTRATRRDWWRLVPMASGCPTMEAVSSTVLYRASMPCPPSVRHLAPKSRSSSIPVSARARTSSRPRHAAPPSRRSAGPHCSAPWLARPVWPRHSISSWTKW